MTAYPVPIVKYLHDKGLLTLLPDPALFTSGTQGPLRVLAEAGLVSENVAIDMLASGLGLEIAHLPPRSIDEWSELRKMV
jgi:hypothetical protein